MPKTTEKAETDRARCTKPNCYQQAAEDSVRCVQHRDEQRASNEAYKKKQGKMSTKGTTRGPYKKKDVKPAAPSVVAEAACRHASWDEWKTNLRTQLEEAAATLRQKLLSVETAIASISAL
jgi:Trm5-related predicted tRNA methylase